MIEGTRAQVWHGTAKRTSGGLTKDDLIKNKHGYIVSKLKSDYMKKNPNKNPLKNYLQKSNSGEFGAIHLDDNNNKTKKTKKTKKKDINNPGLLNTLKLIFN